MKKAIFIIILFSIWNKGISQDNYKKSIIGVGMAASLVVQRVQYLSYDGYFLSFDHSIKVTRITPVFSFSYDYKVNRSFSIGGAFAYQLVELSNNYIRSYKFVSMERYNVSLRALYYYKKHDHFQLYSGLRLGINSNSIMATSMDAMWVESFDSMKGVQYAPQFIGLGANFNMTPDILIVGEICIGTPYIFYLGMAVSL